MTFAQPGPQNRLGIFTSVLSKTIVQQWSNELKESRIFSSLSTDGMKQNISHLFGKLRTTKFGLPSCHLAFNPDTFPSLSRLRLASPQRSLSHLDLPGRALLHCLHHAPVRHLSGPIRRDPQPHRAQPLQLQNQSHDEDRRCLDHIHRWGFVTTRIHANLKNAELTVWLMTYLMPSKGAAFKPHPAAHRRAAVLMSSIFLYTQLACRLFPPSPPLHRWWFTSLCIFEQAALLLFI